MSFITTPETGSTPIKQNELDPAFLIPGNLNDSDGLRAEFRIVGVPDAPVVAFISPLSDTP